MKHKMRVGYIYLFGQTWEEWKKHNKSLSQIIDELLLLRCDKIYMDVFIEDYGFPEIERLDMVTLLEFLSKNETETGEENELIIRGRVSRKVKPWDKKFKKHLTNELERIYNLHNKLV